MINTPGTRQHTLLRTFRRCLLSGSVFGVGAAALCGSLALGCSGSYSTQETPDDDTTPAPAAATTPAATTPAASTSAPRPAAAAPTPAAAAPAAATPAASNPAPAAAASAPAADAPAADAPAAAADELSFATDVWPIFNADCGPCHVDQDAGGHNVGSADKAAALKDAIRLDDAIVAQIKIGTMPLACGGKPPGGAAACVSADDFDKIQAWVKAGTPP